MRIPARSFVVVLFATALVLPAAAQKTMPDACRLVSPAQINALLGTHVGDGKSVAKGKHCAFGTADFKTSIIIEWVDFKKPSTAASILKLNGTSAARQTSTGKKFNTVYTRYVAMPSAGDGFYLTGDYAGKPVVRSQFVLGSYLISFDTDGPELARVAGKLPEIYTIIRNRSGL